MARQIPNANSQLLQSGSGSADPAWFRWLRQLETDHDALQTDYDAHIEDSLAHGWTLLTDKAIVTGSNSIAHGLGYKPTEVEVVKDLAPMVYLEADASAAQSLATATATVIDLDRVVNDFGSNFNTSTRTFTAPHQGIYAFDAAGVLNDLGDTIYSAWWLDCSVRGLRYIGSMKSGAGLSDIRFAGNPSVLLAENETVTLNAIHYHGSNRSISAGLDDTRMVVRSDDYRAEGTHDATNLTIWSARTRTMSFLVR